MSINAILEPPGSENLRDAQRLHIRIEASGELEEGDQARVTIHNLSASGILIETQATLAVGQKIKLALPETSAVPATVVWQSAPLYGCRFDHILSRAVLSAAQLRNPLPSEIDPVFPALASPGNEPLAARIFRLRRARGLSRADVAARTGLSKPSIWSWETGKAVPRHSNISLLAGAFDISEEELLTGQILEHAGIDIPQFPDRSSSSRVEDDGLTVRQVIDASKKMIAQAAGVDESSIRISIDY
ncbi:helix-turn-helix domain-containing protein [Sphingobium fuliginis]|uniref:DNA-binding protein n=1 Tax=Sphingobium fuliginis (strain ATCC 27551) TaxID=336203 RepID=A0A292ZDN5_SPHSA|nr:helix-turn-helix domain-containing protein [Sphingobium fuliginis]GAY20990.1 DNA-binding protein [Sphingobium fuliginis]